ncbi:hypothetical protein G7046_g3822 [Stylonectria norvegica]|nr:hypothetical protein G7046_g3822 [Stylonectria norvegica]
MGDSPQSPKQHLHEFSSNTTEARDEAPTRHSAKEPMTGAGSEATNPSTTNDNQDDNSSNIKPRRSRLKLKDHKSRRRSSRDRDRHRDDDPYRQSHRRHHRRRHRSPTPPDPYAQPTLDPDAAFRESLFDAMADDEGASYWEGVYGQPVHAYSHDKVGPTGKLEQMTDEEYAAHVRQKMWEKTHAGLLEERAQREQERTRRKKEERHSRKLREEMEHSLQRGDERRQRRRWVKRWEDYTQAWADWDGAPATLDWPVESGLRGDVDEKAVRDFFIRGLELADVGEKAFVAKLKDERVRWHPDKIQQRLGGQMDDEVMKHVTAIFQIIDRLWGETRTKS